MKYLIALLLCFFLVGCSRPDSLLDLHNKERNARRLSPLTTDVSLNAAAQQHAEWMAKHNKLEHQSLHKFMKDWNIAGENIAKGQKTEEEVMYSWMHSSGHRANILNKNYTHVGFGKAPSDDGLYWATVFAGK